MTRFVEFTYKDKDNKNITAYYDTEEGTLRIREYKQADDLYDMSNWNVLFVWITLIVFGALFTMSLILFKHMFIEGDLLWLATLADLILAYCCIEIFVISSFKSTKANVENTEYVYNSVEKMQDILERHDKYNSVRIKPSKLEILPKLVFVLTLGIIAYTILTDGKAHLLLFLINYLSAILSQMQIILFSREPSKNLRKRIKSGEVLISNDRKTA